MQEAPLGPVGKSSGLAPIVKQQLEATLKLLAPQWQAEPAADWKRVTRPTGGGSFSISIEPYQGVKSWISFRKKVVGTEAIASLEKLIREKQPELLGYVIHSSGSQLIQDCFALCSSLCRAAVLKVDASCSLENAIANVISELDLLLVTGSAEREILTALSGLKLPDGIDRIELGDELYIRRLTIDEIADLGSNDISSESRFDLTSRFVTTALISKSATPIKLSVNFEDFKPDFSALQFHQDQINDVLSSLHILKSGRVGVVASFTTIRPTILPNMSGHSSAPLVVNPFSFMELDSLEAETFTKLYKALVSSRRDELRISAARLLDAESRLSPVDALLDAVIGLEVLLNPNDRTELSFRVALNYAFLGTPSGRRKRYENVRDVQLTRNRVVHGGLNVKSKDATKLHEHADLAKTCLRDSVTRFLTDESLTGNAKLDADFWLDRVLPPNIM